MRGCECTYDRRPSIKKDKVTSSSRSRVPSANPEETLQVQRDEETVADDKSWFELTSSRFAGTKAPQSSLVSSFSAPSVSGPSSVPASATMFQDLSGLATSNTFQDFRSPSSYAGSSTASASYAPSVSGYSESIDTFLPTYSGLGGGAFAQEAFKVNNELNALFSTEFFDKFFHDYLNDTSSSAPVSQAMSNTAIPDQYAFGFDQFPFATEPVVEVQPFMGAAMPPPLDEDFIEELLKVPDQALAPWPKSSPVPAQPTPIAGPTMPYPSELQQYSTPFVLGCQMRSELTDCSVSSASLLPDVLASDAYHTYWHLHS
jgi:hypothetical protein